MTSSISDTRHPAKKVCQYLVRTEGGSHLDKFLMSKGINGPVKSESLQRCPGHGHQGKSFSGLKEAKARTKCKARV